VQFFFYIILGYISAIWGEKNLLLDLHKILHWGNIQNNITDANFGVDRLRRVFNVAICQILGFSIGFCRRPYNTLALLCECLIWIYSTEPLKFSPFKFGVCDYVLVIYLYAKLGCIIISSGFSPHMWNTTLFCFFLCCPVLFFFLGHAPR